MQSHFAKIAAEVRIVDEPGAELPANSAGEIAVRGPMVMMGYWYRPDETATALRNGRAGACRDRPPGAR